MLRLTILVLVLLQASDSSYKSITVAFPRQGKVEILTKVEQGKNPHVLFRSLDKHETLLDAVIGEGEDWREIVDKGDPQHHLLEEYVVAFHRQGLPDPLLIVMAKYPGGSDCRYKPALFGEVDGRVTQLTSAIPDYDTRGGAFLYTRAGSTVLTVTSERYQEHDVHYLGPSRMAVYRYAWDGARFILKSKAQVSTDAVRTPGEKLDDLFGQALGC